MMAAMTVASMVPSMVVWRVAKMAVYWAARTVPRLVVLTVA